MGTIYPRGTVVLIEGVTDHNDRNPKTRPVVLIRDFSDDDEFAFGVAITGEFGLPLPSTSISLPYANHGKCFTGLTKESIADCTWIVQAHPECVLRRIGHVTSAILLQITEILSRA